MHKIQRWHCAAFVFCVILKYKTNVSEWYCMAYLKIYHHSRNGDYDLCHSSLFSLRTDGSVSGSTSWNGAFWSAYDSVHHRYCGNQNCMDLWNLSISQISVRTVYFLPCILDPYHTDAGMLLLLCEKESTWENEGLYIEYKNESFCRIYCVSDAFCRSFF